MKVKIDDGKVIFMDIKPGSLFCMEQKELYVRCELMISTSEFKYNAVRIRDGLLVYIDSAKLVREVKSITCEV